MKCRMTRNRNRTFMIDTIQSKKKEIVKLKFTRQKIFEHEKV